MRWSFLKKLLVKIEVLEVIKKGHIVDREYYITRLGPMAYAIFLSLLIGGIIFLDEHITLNKEMQITGIKQEKIHQNQSVYDAML